MMIRPVATEKAVKLMDTENTLVFEVGRNVRKEELKKELQGLFDVQISGIRTLMRKNKKYAYVRLAARNPAADLATKLGMI